MLMPDNEQVLEDDSRRIRANEQAFGTLTQPNVEVDGKYPLAQIFRYRVDLLSRPVDDTIFPMGDAAIHA